MRLLQSPAFYLVSSNLLFWGMPLLLIQLRSQTAMEAPVPIARPAQTNSVHPMPLRAEPLITEPLLQAAVAPSPVPVSTPELVRPVLPEPVEATAPLPPAPEPPANLMQELKGAAGLGGPITLESLKEPLMPIAARVERQQQRRSGDALAALPHHWRDSLRQELPAAQSVSEAAVVRLPVPALKQRQEVPVIVNERGEGEALVAPRDQLVRQAVEGWAARQAAASAGTVQVYVVAAEPLPPD